VHGLAEITCGSPGQAAAPPPDLLSGSPGTVIADLFALVEAYDPDIILMPEADT
jgi:hypothetical protein